MKQKLLLFFTLTTFAIAQAQDKKLNISGFSEVRFESRFGDAAEQAQLDSVLANNDNLEDFEENSRLFLPAFNLIFQSDIHEKLSFQSELYLEMDEELRIEFLRMYLEYRINPKFNLQAGKFLSPIGYLNRNQRFYGYLNNSIKPRGMVTEDNGFIPLFTVGLAANGQFDLSDVSFLTYNVAYGMNRLAESTEGDDLFGLEFGEDVSPGISGLLEWTTVGENTELSVGLSGYINPQIETVYLPNGNTFTEGVDPEVEMELKEIGFAPYVRVNAKKFQFIGEYHSIKFEDEESVSGKTDYSYNAGSFEIMYKSTLANKPFGPYVRYDMRELDGYHPYYGLEEEDGTLHKSFVSNESEAVFGFVWDLFPGNRFKIEYGANFSGAYSKGRLGISTSFAF